MFPSRNRLRLSHLTKRRERASFTASNEDFLLSFWGKPGLFKSSVIVTKKVVPKAVDRNRIKRLVYQSLKDLKIKKGEIVIKVKKNLAYLKKRNIQESLQKIISQRK